MSGEDSDSNTPLAQGKAADGHVFFWKVTSSWGSLQETSVDVKKPPFVDSRVLGKPWVLRIYVGLS